MDKLYDSDDDDNNCNDNANGYDHVTKVLDTVMDKVSQEIGDDNDSPQIESNNDDIRERFTDDDTVEGQIQDSIIAKKPKIETQSVPSQSFTAKQLTQSSVPIQSQPSYSGNISSFASPSVVPSQMTQLTEPSENANRMSSSAGPSSTVPSQNMFGHEWAEDDPEFVPVFSPVVEDPDVRLMPQWPPQPLISNTLRMFEDVLRMNHIQWEFEDYSRPNHPLWSASLKIKKLEFFGRGNSEKSAKEHLMRKVLESVKFDDSMRMFNKIIEKNEKCLQNDYILIDKGIVIFDHRQDDSVPKDVKAFYCEFCRFLTYSFKKCKSHVNTFQHKTLLSIDSDERNRFFRLFDENVEIIMSKIEDTIEFRCIRCDKHLSSGFITAETHVNSDSHQNKPNVKHRKSLKCGHIYYENAPHTVNSDVSDDVSDVSVHREGTNWDSNWKVMIKIGDATFSSSAATKEKAVSNALKKHFDRESVKEKYKKEACELYEGIQNELEIKYNDETVPNIKEREKWSVEINNSYGHFKVFRDTVQNAESLIQQKFIRKIIADKKHAMKARVINEISN